MTDTKLNMKYLLAASSIVTLLAAAPEALASARGSLLDDIRGGAKKLKNFQPVIAPVEFIAPEVYKKIISTNTMRLSALKRELASIKDDDGSDDGWDDDQPSAEEQRKGIKADIAKVKAEIDQATRASEAPDYLIQHEAYLANAKREAQLQEQIRLSEQRTYELSQQRIQKELDAQREELRKSQEATKVRIAEKAAAQSLEALQAQREALISKAEEAHKAKIKMIKTSGDELAKRRLAIDGDKFKEDNVDTFDIDAAIALKQGVKLKGEDEEEFNVSSAPSVSSSIPVVDNSKTPVLDKPKDLQLSARAQAVRDRMKAAAEQAEKEHAEKEATQEVLRAKEGAIKAEKIKEEIASTISVDSRAKKQVASKLSSLFGGSSNKEISKNDGPKASVGKLKSNAGGSVSDLFGKRNPLSGKEFVQKTAPITSPGDLENLKAKLIRLAAIEKSKKKALEDSSREVVQSTSNPPSAPSIGDIPLPPPMGNIPLSEPAPSVGSVQEPKVSGLLAEIQKGRALKKMVKKEVVVVVETDEEVRARAQSRLRKVGSDPISAPIKSAEEILAEKAENARKTEEALAKRAAATQKGIEQRAAAKERKRLEFIASGVLEDGASDEDLIKAIENEMQIKNAESNDFSFAMQV